MNPTSSDLRLDALLDRISRRHFLRNSALAAGAMATTSIAFSPDLSAQSANSIRTLVYVFLRGAMDGLSLVVPTGSGADAVQYRSRRIATRMAMDDSTPARRPLVLNGGQPFGLHPAATGLRDLFNRAQSPLAIIHGVGHLDPATYNRSHFDAQEQVELGTPGLQALSHGWLSRHLVGTTRLPGAIFNAVAAASMPPHSLRGWPETVSVTGGSGTSGFHPDPSGSYATTHLRALRTLYAGTGDLDIAAQSALDAVNVISGTNFAAYVPAGGAVYPNTGVANNLKLIATLVRAQIGLNVATVDVGGWDTHNGQGVPTSSYDPYGNTVESLSNGLGAFYQDLAGTGVANFAQRTSIIVMSEFGRRLRMNGSGGTDHGYGNMMMVLGGSVNGGQVYGRQAFAGLAGEALFEGEDVRVTVDFRQVLSEALIRRAANNRLGYIFPGYAGYTPLGIFQGSDLPPDYSASFDRIFAGNFEAA